MSTTLRGVLGVLAVCATVILLSVLGLAGDIVTRLLSNIDGLLLLMICLLMGGLFSLMLFVLLKEAGLLPTHHKQTPAEAPGAAKSGEGKS